MDNNSSSALPVLEPLRKYSSKIPPEQSHYDGRRLSSPPPNDINKLYVNSFPQYDPDVTYDGYDLTKDLTQYQFGDERPESDVTKNDVRKKKKKKIDDQGVDKNGREQWSGRFDFFFSSLGYAVGLGAVWRFPYLCYRNGGGVFLIPYFIFLFLIGIPLFFLELNLGQYTSQGAFQCWRMAPIFKGIGISMCLMSFFLCVYYTMLIAYSILYLVLSFRSNLAWSKCGSWSSSNCTDDYTRFIMRCDFENTYRDPNGRCYSWGDQGLYQIGWWNLQSRLLDRKPVLPSDDYFNNYILNKSPGIDYTSTVEWPLAVSLLAAWTLVFICLIRGIKSSGKVVYFTAVFPYVILLILGIRGWTLPGASKGIEFYMKPVVSKLLDARVNEVWNDAANQIFFVLSVSYGGLITLSSYNRFNQNTLSNTLIITLANVATSIFAGFVIFAYLGYLAYMTGQNVTNVVSEGPGLAFIVYPFAVTTLPAAPLWSILFFLMLITLGLDSVFAFVETITTVITDQFNSLRRHRTIVTFVACVSMFALGLVLCTDALIILTFIWYPRLQLGPYIFPKWANNIGWGLSGLIMSGVVLWALYSIFAVFFIHRKPFSSLFTPEPEWGPLLPQNRKKMKHYGSQTSGFYNIVDWVKNRSK
ncbi:unnamed protein product, partial [Didymodactylos carnosus]